MTESPLFDYTEAFDFSRPKSLYYAFLFLFITIPGFNPAIFQRIAMAKNTLQVRRSFTIAAITCMLITAITFWVGTLVLSTHPTLKGDDIVQHILSNFSYVGLRGLTLSGIMAMVMSTADSYVNSTSILFVHDLCAPLKIKIIENELVASRVASIFIGIFAIVLALRSDSLLHLLITTNIFYMPIVTIPFVMAVFGFRTSSKSALIGMAAGFLTVILWETFWRTGAIDGLIPGMIANLVFLVGSHYLLRQSSGWVGIKDNASLAQITIKRNIKI